MIGGFNDWAHLRPRDHRPGPMSYEQQPSDAPKMSILRKYNPRPPDMGVGPGEYQIPTTVGECRSTVFGPPTGPMIESATGSPQKRSRRGPPVGPLPKQYSLALLPDTPSYSIAPRVSYEFDKPASGVIGPGEYYVPSLFDPNKTGIAKGLTFGERTNLMSSADKVPGPGSYNVPRFGDNFMKKKEYITSIRRVVAREPGPGPGCYEDLTTISARFTKPRLRLNDEARFGRRYPANRINSIGPGPARYGDVSRVMAKKTLRTPIFHPPFQTIPPSKTLRIVSNGTPGPGEYCIPSEFDQDFRKGATLAPRLNGAKWISSTSAVGPGQYDLGKPPGTARGFRFAAHPYDPTAVEEVAAAAAASRAAGGSTGSPMYFPNFDSVHPKKYCAVRGFGVGSRFPDITSPGPLCYDVKPPASNKGVVFYRGDYSRSRYLQQGQGPVDGALYNVDNDTISEGVRLSKGFTFGIRYPARATHQVCKPRDETTNVNCEYPDEQTWMIKPATM